MSDISSQIIYETVKKLCLQANTVLTKQDYFSLSKLYEYEDNIDAKSALKQILENAQIACEEKRPLCQDTGFVTIFLKTGQNVKICGTNINAVCNKAVSDAYKEFYLRKSIVAAPYTKRINTNDNTPVLIHTEIIDGDEIEIILSVKGGGCENVSAIKMLNPTFGKDRIKEFVLETIRNAGSKPCPPIITGIGIGSNFEGAAILSKKALLLNENEGEDKEFAKEILDAINELNTGVMGLGGKNTCFRVNILSQPCHIASLPVAISISCHSSRHAKAIIKPDTIIYECETPDFQKVLSSDTDNTPVFHTDETEKIKNLEPGSNIRLTGKIYTARDAAHKKFHELIENGKPLPFDIKNAIIFYAGPCPSAAGEITGPIGPTTSARMDKFTEELYKLGLLATIGKGERSQALKNYAVANNCKYFSATGGIASLLKNCVISSKIIAYPELGTEAVYELGVEKLPLHVMW